MTYIATVDKRDLSVEVVGPREVVVGERAHHVDLRTIDGEYLYSLLLDDESFEVFVERREGVYYVTVAGSRYAVDVQDARLKQLRVAGRMAHEVGGSAAVEAPMPGLVVRVLVRPGEVVSEDQGVVLLEAMKMENEVRAPRSGVVRQVAVQSGDTVNGGDVLLVIDEEAADRPATGAAPDESAAGTSA